MSSDGSMNRETHDLAKRVVLEFLGDDPYVRQQFLNDLIIPEPPYPAPEIILQVASHLREFSQLFYNVITPLVIAYLFHRLHKREAKKSQEKLEAKLGEILKEHRKEVTDCLQRNEELRIRFKPVKLEKLVIQVKPGMKAKWELRLNVYSDRANLVKNPDDAAKLISKILKELVNDKLNQ